MKTTIKHLTRRTRAFLPLAVVFAAAAVAHAGGITLQSSATLKKTFPRSAKPDQSKVLGIAAKYHKIAMSRATNAEKILIRSAIPWTPDFSGKSVNRNRVSGLNPAAANLTAFTNMKGLYLAVNAALFASDPANPVSADNLATAIVSYVEDASGKPLNIQLKANKPYKSYGDDAAIVYDHALALKLTSPTVGSDALPILLNYGYFCIDANRLPTARLLMETAARIAPTALSAEEGVAAYWLAAGDKVKARKALAKAQMPFRQKKIKEMEEKLSIKAFAETASLPTDSAATAKAKLEKAKALPLFLATDFYADLDPAGALRARQHVAGLARQWKHGAPNIAYLTQYSTLPVFEGGHGTAAMEAFQQSLDELGKVLDRLYPPAPDGGIPPDPWPKTEYLVLKLAPGNYANPTDVRVQQKNVVLMMTKIRCYQIYIVKELEEVGQVTSTNRNLLTQKIEPLNAACSAALEALAQEHQSSHPDQPPGDPCDICVSKTHKIHQEYDTQRNQTAERYWMNATNFASARYTRHIKPAIDAMYSETMKHCMLITDPRARESAEFRIRRDMYLFTESALAIVEDAYRIDTDQYPWECDCSEAEIEATHARLAKWQADYEYSKTIMENKARKDFESCKIMESSPLYKSLDRYSASFSLFFMNAKWHPMKTEASMNLKVGAIGLNLSELQNHMGNMNTYGGGISIGQDASTAGGALGAELSLGLRGEVTTNGQGNIIRSEMVGSAEASATAGFLQAGAKAEYSTMRGCRTSAEVAVVYNDEFMGSPKELAPFMPEKPRKVLWTGSFE